LFATSFRLIFALDLLHFWLQGTALTLARAALGSSSSLLQQKIVIKLGMPSAKNRKEAMALAAKVHGTHARVSSSHKRAVYS